jgi:hypothetical protein
MPDVIAKAGLVSAVRANRVMSRNSLSLFLSVTLSVLELPIRTSPKSRVEDATASGPSELAPEPHATSANGRCGDTRSDHGLYRHRPGAGK